VSAPVSSNMITTTVTVSLVIPLSVSAVDAPDSPKSSSRAEESICSRSDAGGVWRAHGKPRGRRVCATSRRQRERDKLVVNVVVTHVCSALTRMPTIRPNIAPTAMDGTKIPQGTLQPYETTTRAVLTTTARSSELTIRHCADVLRRQFRAGTWTHWQSPS
jgi:hypothetical protein